MRRNDARREHRDLSARWRLLRTGARSGRWNMACDGALLDAAERTAAGATIRFYAWARPTVSIGRHQSAPDAAVSARLESAGWEWVRRPTGGRAVYHGTVPEELTYSVVARLGAPPFDTGWRAGYRTIHEALAAGLRELGVDAVVTPGGVRRGTRPVGPSSRQACFASSVPGEIVVAGRKLVGSAQRRTRQAILQHGSIPLAGDPLRLNALWSAALEADASTTVSAAGVPDVDPVTVMETLAGALARALNVELVPGVLSDTENEAIERSAGALAIA